MGPPAAEPLERNESALAGGYHVGDFVVSLIDDAPSGVARGFVGTVMGPSEDKQAADHAARLCVRFEARVTFTDTDGDAILFLRKPNGKLDYYVNGALKVADVYNLSLREEIAQAPSGMRRDTIHLQQWTSAGRGAGMHRTTPMEREDALKRSSSSSAITTTRRLPTCS